jgi:hypothetical protein
VKHPGAAPKNRNAPRWLRHAAGGNHSAAAGIHLGIAFGGPGLPVKLNYGVTGRFGQDKARVG